MHVVSTHPSDHRHTNALKAALADIDAPGWAVVFGDRRDMLEAALDLHYQGIKLVHVGGGDTPHGTDSHPDHRTRDAISMLARVHCVANEWAAENLGALLFPTEAHCGEWSLKRIHITGSPGLDEVVAYAKTHPRASYGIARDVILIHDHPSDRAKTKAWRDEAWSHTDPDSNYWIQGEGEPLPWGCDSRLGLDAMLKLMSSIGDGYRLITNSSCGLYEAPIIGCETVMIGDRQAGRRGPYHHPEGRACEAIRKVVLECCVG